MACQEGFQEDEEISIKVKLLKLHCPFTWEMQDSTIKHSIMYINNCNIDHDTIEDETSCPLELLIKSLFKCYKAVVSADHDEAKKNITKAEDVLMNIQQGQELCRISRAIEHVFYATKCFFLYESEEDSTLLEEILKNIDDTEKFNNEELGALYGCQSVVWSSLNDYGVKKAIDIAKKAIEKNQDCALWHFILGKNLRRQRRSINVSSEVSDMERKHFEIAYAISKNDVFGIYYLQMRMESFYKFRRGREHHMRKINNEKQVLQIAKEIVKTKPTNYRVLLKLALMFLRANVSDETLLAKECLDAVKQITPSNTTYMHYTAMLYQQCGDYKGAIKYFKKAAEGNNFVAELSYVQFGWETGEMEPLPHLLRMSKKYEHLVKERQIALNLAIAVAYFSLHNNIKNAAEYFLKALTIDPRNNKFKTYYKYLDFNTLSISSFLNDQFCPLLERKNFRETSQKIKDLLNVRNVTTDDVTDLSEEFGNLCANDKTVQPELNI
ncbi:uncharacterized protein [Polyergus mexicanus]|uniref:uncharacterized protein n=1 Tax=Polyergus mexicanus TaxID=615972 RepID=UPI0038B4CFFA